MAHEARQAGEKLLPVKIDGHYLMYFTHPSSLAVSDNLIDCSPEAAKDWAISRLRRKWPSPTVPGEYS